MRVGASSPAKPQEILCASINHRGRRRPSCRRPSGSPPSWPSNARAPRKRWPLPSAGPRNLILFHNWSRALPTPTPRPNGSGRTASPAASSRSSAKSAFATDVIARVTTGSAWPCQEGTAPNGAVLLIAPQGDPDVFGLRFRAAGGDWAGLHVLREVKDGSKARPFDLDKDLAGLTALIEGVKDLRLIAIDAVHVPAGRGAAAARKTEALFEQLAALARRHNVAVLAIARQAGGDYLNRKPISFGTLPLTAATMAFVVEIDPNDEGRRLLLQVKNELSGDPGTLAFGIVRREHAAAIAFAPAKPTLSPREFTARNAPGFNSAKAEAIAFLRGLFAKAIHLKVTDIEAEARAVGLLGANQPLSQRPSATRCPGGARPHRDPRRLRSWRVVGLGKTRCGEGGSKHNASDSSGNQRHRR